MKKTAPKLLAGLLAFSLVAVACGSDDDGDGDDAPADTEAPADDAPADTEAPADDAPADTEAPADDGDGGEGDGDGDASGGSANVEAAAAVAAEFTEPATEIGPTIPLDEVPPTGLRVAWLQCEVTCADFDPGFEAATDALGWELDIIGIGSFGPAEGFQQAFDLGADYIAITGTPPALYQDQLDQAIEQGIPVMSCYETTVPAQEENGIWMQCGDGPSVEVGGNAVSNRIIAESDGTAHELMVNIPDFPVLVAERDGAARAYDENCPDTCTFSELNVTLDQLLAGEVGGAIISALQEDESITHVRFAFDAMAVGIADVLDEAGLLERVELVGVDLNGAIAQDIVDGKHQYWTTNPVVYAAWLMVDAMARHSIGQDNPEERDNAVLPTYFVDSPEKAEEVLATGGDWPGPEGQEDMFTALWGV